MLATKRNEVFCQITSYREEPVLLGNLQANTFAQFFDDRATSRGTTFCPRVEITSLIKYAIAIKLVSFLDGNRADRKAAILPNGRTAKFTESESQLNSLFRRSNHSFLGK
jgi:hypothetical protein